MQKCCRGETHRPNICDRGRRQPSVGDLTISDIEPTPAKMTTEKHKERGWSETCMPLHSSMMSQFRKFSLEVASQIL